MLGPKFGTVKAFYKNQSIFKEGQIGNVGYLIKTGEVTIYKIIDDEKKILNLLGPGEIFGEMGLITDLPRTACAQASEYCDLVVIDKETLHKLLKQSPKLIQSITLFLMRRLGSTLHLLEQTKTEDISIKQILCVCHLLDLVCQNGQPVDYHRFCAKAKDITGLNLKQMREIIEKLNQINLIKINTDNKGVISDDAKISIIGDNPFFLQAAKQLDNTILTNG